MSNQLSSVKIDHLLLGMCGTIAASTMPSAIAWMRYTTGIQSIQIILTQTAQKFVAPDALQALCDNHPPVTDWHSAADTAVPHLDLPAAADVFLIMPASANIMGKVAHGLADDVLSTTIMGADIPVVFVPTMNEIMWNKPAVQRNVRQLREDGYTVLEPRNGYEVATGKPSFGSMADLPVVLETINNLVQSSNSQSINS